MSHMVIYRSVEGQPVFHQVENLEDAARHVETLRNGGQGDDARIFAMKEVKIEVKTYYRVEVASDEAAPAAPAKPVVSADRSESVASAPPPAPAPATPPVAAATAPAAAPSAPAAVKPEPAAAGAAANGGRFGLFGKG